MGSILRTRKNIFQNRIMDYNDMDDIPRKKAQGLIHLQGECTVWGALAFILRISRWLAIAPLRVVSHRDCSRVSLSSAMSVYSYLLILTLDATLFAGLAIDLSVERSHAVRVRGQMQCFVWLIDVAIVTLIANIGVFSANKRMKQIIPCLNHINTILSKIDNDRHRQTPERKRCVLIALSLLGVLCLGLSDFYGFMMAAITYNRESKVVYLYMAYYINCIITVCLEMQFIFTAFLANAALKSINEILSNLLSSIDTNSMPNFKHVCNMGTADVDNFLVPAKAINIIIDSVTLMGNNYTGYFSASQSKKAQETIRRLVLAYTATCDVVRQIDSSHGLLLLLLLLSFLIHLVVTPYYFIAYLLSPKVGLPPVLMQLCWCLYHITKMVFIVEPGHRTQREMDRTQTLVGQLMSRMSSPHDALTADLELFFRQLMLNQVSYSPLGMCVLGRPIIATILGGVTTYLVIIVQFQAIDKI